MKLRSFLPKGAIGRRPAPADAKFTHEVPVARIPPGEAGNAILHRNLLISTALSRHYVKHFITPEKVIDVLNAAGVRFLLAGAHASSVWSNQPRTTQDVDILALGRHARKAAAALSNAFPSLTVIDTPVVTRFRDPRTNVIVLDVMKPNQALFKVAHQHTHTIRKRAREYKLPSLEFMLAMKFAAMVSPFRQDKKLLDAFDFRAIVRANDEIDLPRLSRLGRLVYAGGGTEILELVRRVRANEPLEL